MIAIRGNHGLIVERGIVGQPLQSEPSTLALKTSADPLRRDVNTTQSPSGEIDGFESRTDGEISLRSLLASASAMTIALFTGPKLA